MKQDLLQAWLDDELTDAQQAELADWLKLSIANRREFVALNLREEQLRATVKAGAVLENQTTVPSPRKASIPLALAAVATLAIGLFFFIGEGRTVATVQSARKLDLPLSNGDPLTIGQKLTLNKGRIAIRFATGAKLAIAAPADLEILGPNAARLTRGEATVRVPGKIKGFELQTPTEKVIDLGTAFGVHVDSQTGATAISVFEGEVKLGSDRHLFAGHSIALPGEKDNTPREIPYTEGQFADTWEISFGIEALEGNVRLATPSERPQPGQVQDNGSLLLFPEKEGITLGPEFIVNATEPGEYRRPFRKQALQLGKKVLVDSFLLQYSPSPETQTNRKFEGKLRFDRPVVAVILSKDLLDASDAPLGLSDTDFSGTFRRGINVNDVVTISENRKSLHINFDVSQGVDQIRVLLQHTDNL